MPRGRAGGAGPGGCLSFAFGRERPCAFRLAIRLFHGNFWLESGLTSKPIQRRVALGVKALTICNSPVITSSHSAFHWKGFALLSSQYAAKLKAWRFDGRQQYTAFAERNEMIPKRLRPIFAKERRPLLVGHLVLSLALVPIPMIRTGWVEAALILSIFPSQVPGPIGLWFLMAGSVVSLPLIPLFLTWSLPGATRLGLPKRSIGALCLLVAVHPSRFYFEGIFNSIKIRAEAANLHDRFPVFWLIKHLDTPLLLGLVVWAILRHQTVRAHGKLWFHWALFVCVLCAAFAPFDSNFGFLVMPRFE